MTDNEIIKALEDEVKSAEYVDSYYCNGVDLTLIKSAIDLINRQKAEIEELKIENKSLRSAANCYKLHCNETRTEAIKEFADRLKNEINIRTTYSREQDKNVMRMIDNLVKELISDE